MDRKLSQVSVSINNRSYKIACDDGQEAHLLKLGAYIDKRFQELKAAVGDIDHSRLLVMVALLLADELSDAYTELEGVKSNELGAAKASDQQEAISLSLDILAKKIERIAESVEAT